MVQHGDHIDPPSDTPATIPVAVSGFASALGPALGYFFSLDPAGIVVLSTLIIAASNVVLAVYLNRTTTSSTAPRVERGTPVAIEGTEQTVIVQPDPPGPEVVKGDGTPTG